MVVLAGCGSSSAGNSTSPTDTTTAVEGSLTKAEFIARADVLCEDLKAKQEPLHQGLEEVARKARAEERSKAGISDGTRRELAQALGRIVAIGEAGLSQVQALGIPEAGAAQLEAIFQKTESAFETSLAYGAALENHEDANAQAIAETGNAETRETAALAERYGFKVCGSPP
jgi:hypothetical protein